MSGVDADRLVSTNGSGSSLVLLLGNEPTEHVVIKTLGQTLAQAYVDLAFAQARLAAVRAAVGALWSVAKPIEAGCDCMPPDGYIVPADTLMTLQSLVG